MANSLGTAEELMGERETELGVRFLRVCSSAGGHSGQIGNRQISLRPGPAVQQLLHQLHGHL